MRHPTLQRMAERNELAPLPLCPLAPLLVFLFPLALLACTPAPLPPPPATKSPPTKAASTGPAPPSSSPPWPRSPPTPPSRCNTTATATTSSSTPAPTRRRPWPLCKPWWSAPGPGYSMRWPAPPTPGSMCRRKNWAWKRRPSHRKTYRPGRRGGPGITKEANVYFPRCYPAQPRSKPMAPNLNEVTND